MFKEIVVTTILSLCFYCIKSENFCAKILVNKGYIASMQKAINNSKENPTNSKWLCDMPLKFSHKLFNDPEGLMCMDSVISYLEENTKVWKQAQDKCKMKTDAYKTLRACKSVAKFQTCVHNNMLTTLKGLAGLELWSENACQKCKEFPFLVKCANRTMLHKTCSEVFRALNRSNFAKTSCEICRRNGNKVNNGELVQANPAKPPHLKVHEKSANKVVIIVMAVGVSTGILIFFAAVTYYLYRQAKMDQEIENLARTGSQAPLDTVITFTSLKSD